MSKVARPRINPKGTKKPLPVRIDPELLDWLRELGEREGWNLTETTEWALSGVRYLERKLGHNMEELFKEQREHGDSVFVALLRRLAESYERENLSELKPIVPHPGKRTGRS